VVPEVSQGDCRAAPAGLVFLAQACVATQCSLTSSQCLLAPDLFGTFMSTFIGAVAWLCCIHFVAQRQAQEGLRGGDREPVSPLRSQAPATLTGVRRGAAVHAVLRHQAADGEGPH
jgi:hypothetical protein